ncbi:MAG: hypothetical protein IT303_19105 [Dehalococcoidia bacterium]|nr:hypothetical protein [Dehalococcoidia bacterium]
MRRVVLVVAGPFAALMLMVVLLVGRGGANQADAATLPALPAGWPAGIQVGLSDSPGGAAAMKAAAPFGFRYQYLAGGVNTGGGWATWNTGGQFPVYYIQDSVANGIVPVFTYYMIYQSSPGNAQGEWDGVYNNLQNTATMTAYWNDLKLFFQRAGGTGAFTVLHVEPDMWGFMQQRAGTADNAALVSAKVAATGVPELAGLPDTVAGFAQAVVRLRDQYAPNVKLGYHISVWGTGDDIQYSNPTDARVDALATRAANFYLSLGANFDVAFGEFTDRDAAFKQYQYGDGGASWWDASDFARHARFLAKFTSLANERVVLWQIPLGNTRMKAMNNTWGHYQDNRVEWFFDDPSRANLAAYANAGVVAFLYGGGAGGTSCACDGTRDGVTNPAPINGNTLDSYSADDDGGFFRRKVKDYYTAGVQATTGGGGATATPTKTLSTPTKTATATPSSTPTKTATATGTPTKTATATSTPTKTATAAPTTATPKKTATPTPTTRSRRTAGSSVTTATPAPPTVVATPSPTPAGSGVTGSTTRRR